MAADGHAHPHCSPESRHLRKIPFGPLILAVRWGILGDAQSVVIAGELPSIAKAALEETESRDDQNEPAVTGTPKAGAQSAHRSAV